MTSASESVPSISAEGVESLNVLVSRIAVCAVALDLHLNGDGPAPPVECREFVLVLGDPDDGVGSVTIIAPAR